MGGARPAGSSPPGGLVAGGVDPLLEELAAQKNSGSSGYVSILFIICHIVTFSSSIVQNILCTHTTAAVKGTNVPRVVEHY